MITISKGDNDSQARKKRKKSFWFEFAEEEGLNPHKSAWSDYLEDKKKNQKVSRLSTLVNFCSKCGFSLQFDAKFCERCGQKIRVR